MKNRIISFVLALTLIVSALLGTTVFANAEDSSAALMGTSLNLAENVTVKMSVDVKSETKNTDNAKVFLGDKEIKTLPVNEALTYEDYYIFEAEVAIKDFAKDVTLKLFKEGEEKPYATVTTSAAKYCENYVEKYPTGEFRNLIDALSVYADAADRYFDDSKAAAPSVPFDVSNIPDMERNGEMPEGIAHTGATLILESETTVRHYFELANGKRIENYKFFVDLDT